MSMQQWLMAYLCAAGVMATAVTIALGVMTAVRWALAERRADSAWRHAPTAATPPAELWRLVVEDLEREESVVTQLQCLKRWRERGHSFTLYEHGAILDMLEPMTPGTRDAVRAILGAPSTPAR